MVLASLAIGQQWENDTRNVLFVKLRYGLTLDEELTALIKDAIRAGATPRLVPAKVVRYRGTRRSPCGPRSPRCSPSALAG